MLDGENMRDVIYKMIMDIVENAVDTCIAEDSDPEEWDFTELNELLLPIDSAAAHHPRGSRRACPRTS